MLRCRPTARYILPNEETVSAKEVHMSGEYSKDGGKTWKPDHDITCKK